MTRWTLDFLTYPLEDPVVAKCPVCDCEDTIWYRSETRHQVELDPDTLKGVAAVEWPEWTFLCVNCQYTFTIEGPKCQWEPENQ